MPVEKLIRADYESVRLESCLQHSGFLFNRTAHFGDGMVQGVCQRFEAKHKQIYQGLRRSEVDGFGEE